MIQHKLFMFLGFRIALDDVQANFFSLCSVLCRLQCLPLSSMYTLLSLSLQQFDCSLLCFCTSCSHAQTSLFVTHSISVSVCTIKQLHAFNLGFPYNSPCFYSDSLSLSLSPANFIYPNALFSQKKTYYYFFFGFLFLFIALSIRFPSEFH